MADRPGEADAIRADLDEMVDVLGRLRGIAADSLAALDRLTARLSEADRVKGALVETIAQVDRAEARLSETERERDEAQQWCVDEAEKHDATKTRLARAEARLSDYEQALRFYAKGDNWMEYPKSGDWLLDCPKAMKPWDAARDALSGSTEIPSEDLDWDNAEVHGRETEGNEE